MMLVIAIVLLFAPCLAVAQSVPVALCGDIDLDQPLRVDFEFPVSQSTKFCPGTTYPDSPDDPSNLVFTPIGPAETTTAADLNGSYSVTDELGLAGVCMRFDEAQTLVVSLNQQTVDVFGELTATFNSVSGSITNFVVSYGPGGFNTVGSSRFALGPNPLDSRSGVWNSTGLQRFLEVRLCEVTSASQLADVAPFVMYGQDVASGCPRGQRGAIQYSLTVGEEAVQNPRNYTLVLIWPLESGCSCQCGDCIACKVLMSDAVELEVVGIGDTSPTSSSTSTPTEGLGTGAIIGIAAGVCVGLAFLGVVVVLCCFWHRNPRMCSAKVAELGHTHSTHELSGIIGGSGGPVGKEKVSSHQNEDSTDYEPPLNQNRTIAFVVDRLIEVKAEWFTAFKSALASKHHAKPVVPAFTSQLLKRELDDYLQNENCDCLYLLQKGSSEQHHQNGTTDSSHVPIQRIVRESFLHHSNCEKVVLVQFGITSPQPELVLANGPRVVNLDDVHPDNAPGDSGSRWAETVFRHVRPMLMERHAVLMQAADRATRVTPNEREDPRFLQVLESIERTTKVIADNTGQHTDVIRQIGGTTEENLDLTREFHANQQRDGYAPSQAVTTTGE